MNTLILLLSLYPNTGDTNNLGLWIGLLAGALAAAGGAIYLIKKKDREK